MDPLKYQNQNNNQEISYNPDSSKKTWIIIGIIIGVLIIAGTITYIILNKKATIPPTSQEPTTTQTGFPAGDTTTDIQRELNSIDLGDLNAEIRNTDSDIKNL